MQNTHFVGGKLKLKRPYQELSGYKNIKKILSKDLKTLVKNNQRKIEEDSITGCININEEIYIKALEENINKNVVSRINMNNEKEIISNDSGSQRIYDKIDDIIDTRTTTEKLFDERKDKRLPELIKKTADMTFKKKFENFNKLLSKLPEHYDIPKVGPG